MGHTFANHAPRSPTVTLSRRPLTDESRQAPPQPPQPPQPPMAPMAPMVFDFFCGCGGGSAGLRAAGMDIVLGLDNDEDARRTFTANFPNASFIGSDIAGVAASALDAAVTACGAHPLVFNVCAPCQPFSQQRGKPALAGDDRIGLISHLSRFISRHLPDVIVAENVPGLRNMAAGGDVFQSFVSTLQELGYSTDHQVVQSQDYGVPQRRARLILLASRFGPITLPPPTHGDNSPRLAYSTVRDWIGGFPAIAAGESHPDVPNHRAAQLSLLNIQRIRATPPGGGWRDLPPDLMPDSRKSGFGGFTDVYGRLRWDGQSPALTTRCTSYSNGRFGHPDQDRAISVREAAALQTIPDNFVITGSLTSQTRQVGNAVPSLLAQRIGERIIHHLQAVTAPHVAPLAPGMTAAERPS